MDMKRKTTDLLHELGVPAHILGYEYLREAIVLTVEEPKLIRAITTQLYPRIASTFKTTPSRVERAIRFAIETAWNRADLDTLREYFGHTVSAAKGKSTNKEFITLVVDRLRLAV